jgi:hypothetical protein
MLGGFQTLQRKSYDLELAVLLLLLLFGIEIPTHSIHHFHISVVTT